MYNLAAYLVKVYDLVLQTGNLGRVTCPSPLKPVDPLRQIFLVLFQVIDLLSQANELTTTAAATIGRVASRAQTYAGHRNKRWRKYFMVLSYLTSYLT